MIYNFFKIIIINFKIIHVMFSLVINSKMAECSGGTAEKTDASSAADNSRKHPLYKTLSRFNRELNKLKPEEIRDRLRRENLSDQ